MTHFIAADQRSTVQRNRREVHFHPKLTGRRSNDEVLSAFVRQQDGGQCSKLVLDENLSRFDNLRCGESSSQLAGQLICGNKRLFQYRAIGVAFRR